MNQATIAILIETGALLLVTIITVGAPFMFRYLSQKWKLDVEEGTQRMLMDAARRAVRYAEEEAWRRYGTDQQLSGDEKHAIANAWVKQACRGKGCSAEEVDDAVSVAVNELREGEMR